MLNLDVILLLLALVCFVVAALGVAVRNVNMLAAGLAFWVLTLLV